MQIADIREDQIPILLYPDYVSRQEGHPLERDGMIRYNERRECYERTREGEALVNNLRMGHRMTWDPSIPGGGRWVVAGKEIHCGNTLEVMLGDGTWQRVRFEVAWSSDVTAQATGGRIPKLYITLVGGEWLTCDFEPERGIFRWPCEDDR